MSLLGWDYLDLGKSEGMCTCISLLGCTVSVPQQGVEWRLHPRKAAEWRREVEESLAVGSLSPALAGKFAGRFNFACSRAFGREGRFYIRPLYWRQSSHGSWKLTKRLRSCFRWWAALPEA
eukprot:7099445-Pyramimonas_sp.AAC.1